MGEPYEASNGQMVTVEEVLIVKLIRAVGVHIDVVCLDDHQFAVVDAEATDADGTSILRDIRLALDVDGVQYPQADQHSYGALPPESSSRPGQPALPAPISDATNAAVVWLRTADSSVRWELPPETVERLGQAPVFVVREFETPDPVTEGAAFEASMTVANTGERDGRFVTELGAGPISDYGEVMLDVPAGTERTHTELVRPYLPENRDEIEVVLDWGCDRLRRTISVTN